MATNRQTHQVGKIKKLIDLNGDTTNFDITFRVASRNKEPFDILVVDQTTLDNNPSLEYKKVENGAISGNVIQDKNVYQNYFIILKADNACECDVEIIKKELPKTTQPPPQLPQGPQGPPQPTPSPLRSGKKPENGFSWVKILLIIGAIVALGIGLYLYSKKSKGEDNAKPNETKTGPPEAGFRFYSPPKSSASHGSPPKGEAGGKGHDLLARLKRLNLN
jgi:hypothetical protein